MNNPAKKINKVVGQYKQLPIYTRAITVHRNHKGVKLSIPPGHYLEQIYKDNNRQMCIEKATQVGVSELLITRAFYRAEIGKSIFYVMPTYELKNQFVRERVDKSILNSTYYQNVLSGSEYRVTESMSMKQIVNGVIAFVGSNTSNAFISFQADDVIIDEFDNCNQENLLMAEERQSASVDKTNIYVGNPTISKFGINNKYLDSCKYTWFVKCQCGEWITPDFFTHVMNQVDTDIWIVRDKDWKPDGEHQARTYCHKCGNTYDRFSPGEWVAERSEIKMSGYSISKMFATMNTTNELIKRFSDGLVNDFAMQRFYNGDLGLPYTSAGAKISIDMLNDCIDDTYAMPEGCTNACVAGVDVGTVFNVIIGDVVTKRIVFIGELPVHDISEVRDLFRKYNVRLYVADALPETRIVRQIIARNKYGFMNYFSNMKNELTINIKGNILSTNRTVCLDAVKEAIITKEFILPANSKTIPGFMNQMTASTRVYNEEKNTFSWVESGPDHYFLAWCYMLLAKRIMVMAQ